MAIINLDVVLDRLFFPRLIVNLKVLKSMQEVFKFGCMLPRLWFWLRWRDREMGKLV